MRAYLDLTKPRISLLFAISGLAALLIEKSLITEPFHLGLIVFAIFLIGGSANAFNQYFEREIDSRMTRTAKKRPLPLGKMSPRAAWIFSTVIGVAGTTILFLWGGWLAASLGLGTILFYALYYTLWLKPRTPYNIVIGGIAGSTGPLIAWAAATGKIGWVPFIIFLIIFFWTPPHFWALALGCKEDYAKVGYPMLPLVIGDEATRRQILYYSISLIPLTGVLSCFKGLDWIYAITALLLSFLFVWYAVRLIQQKTTRASWQLFGYSILYLMLLFVTMIVDTLFIG